MTNGEQGRTVTLPQVGGASALRSPRVSLPELPGDYRYRFHAMVKPAGSLCNLDCTYCYYLHKGSLLDQPRTPKMSDEVLQEHIRQYIEGQTAEEVVFSWQGGEPTLMGLGFFERVIELQQKYRKTFQRIENDLQTNGTLLDEAWVKFLKKNRFLVGLSCDGPAELHDQYRVTKGGKPTFAKVLRAARLLKEHGVPFNALCVVNRTNAKHGQRVYRFLTRELGTWRVQFIPCVEPKDFQRVAPQRWEKDSLPVVGSERARPGGEGSIVTEWSVDPDDWGQFLCDVWDDWYRRDLGKVHVNWFESAVAQTMGMPSQNCITGEFCGKGMAVEHNGDAYSCDHYVYPEYRVGNIRERHLAEMVFSEEQKRFGFGKCDSLPRQCRECSHLSLCWGECPKNRIVRTPEGEVGLNYLCPGLRRFWAHTEMQRRAIAQKLRSGN